MNVIEARAALKQAVIPPLEKTDKPIDWRREYNKMRAAYIMLQPQYAAEAIRSPERLQTDLADVQAFLESMPTAEGAVSCANVYNQAFFQQERDLVFAVELTTKLLEHFYHEQVLIPKAYDYWTNINNGGEA